MSTYYVRYHVKDFTFTCIVSHGLSPILQMGKPRHSEPGNLPKATAVVLGGCDVNLGSVTPEPVFLTTTIDCTPNAQLEF